MPKGIGYGGNGKKAKKKVSEKKLKEMLRGKRLLEPMEHPDMRENPAWKVRRTSGV